MQRRFDDFRPYNAEQIAFFGNERGIKAPNVQGAIEESLFNNPSIRSLENTFRGKSILGNNIVAYNTDRKPTLVLVFDDGLETDYEVLYPIAKEYKVPINLAIIPIHLTGVRIPLYAERSRIRRPLTIDEMREMQDSGYISFLNHGLTHTRLRNFGARVTPKQNDTVIYPYVPTELRRIWVYEEVDFLLIDSRDNNINETVTVTSINEDSDGQIYFTLKHPIKNNYTNSPLFVPHPKNTMEREIKDGAELLRIYGFGDNDAVFVYPFGAMNKGITDIVVAKYYGGAFATTDGMNFVENIPLSSYNLRRDLVFDGEVDKREQIDSALEQCVNDKGFVCLMGHSWDMTETGIANLKYTIEKCMDLGIEITTAREALDRFSNKIQIGDDSMNNHFIVDRENNIHIKSLIFTLPNGDRAKLSLNNDGEIQVEKL